MFGLTPDDVIETVEIWPEHAEALELFRRMSTQWRVGAGGATGLDYVVLYRMMDRMNLTTDRYDELEEEVGIMERAALAVMHKQT